MTKKQREQIRLKFGGNCAYCGQHLDGKWHADHLIPVIRQTRFAKGKGLIATGRLENPQFNTIENMMPACPSCNIDKSRMSLEDWREKLHSACGVLKRNQPTYRHALRFGLVKETSIKIIFYFERLNWVQA